MTSLLAGTGLAFGQGMPGPAPSSPADVRVLPYLPSPAHGDPTPALGLAAQELPGRDTLGSIDSPRARDGSRVFVSAEYLLWWIKGSPLPSQLITTGSLDNGGAPLSGDDLTYGPLSGVRVTAGVWLDNQETLGLEVSGFVLPQHTRTIGLQSDETGNPVVAFRYLDPPVGGVSAEDAFLAAVPDVLNAGPPQVGPYMGSVAVTSRSRLWGTEANLVRTVYSRECFQLRVLGGVRYVDLDESLDLAFSRQTIAGSGADVFFQGTPFPDPSAVSSVDSFQTRSQFYGGQIGAAGAYSFGKLAVGLGGKVALGGTHEVVSVLGTSTLVTGGGPSITVPGGQFAAPSNSGRSARDEFAVVPEVELAVQYQILDHVQLFAGYDFLYWSRVVRPGRQADLVVDTRGDQIDPAFTGETVAYPRPLFKASDFWAQGLNFGVSLCY
jgi:hypothetical protein